MLGKSHNGDNNMISLLVSDRKVPPDNAAMFIGLFPWEEGEMQFLIIARDGADAEAPARRQAARPDHLKGATAMVDEGILKIGGAILDDDGAMVGSAAIVDFPDREALDAWLRSDPYVTGGVWKTVEVHPFRVAVSSGV
jgi:uncharacterized protein